MRSVVRCSALSLLVGILGGLASALFLWSLDLATHAQASHPELLYALPVAGLLVVWLYATYSQESLQGNALVFQRIRAAGEPVPWLMAPLVLVTTLLTHLFGGSAGREGTAVQMGGALAQVLAKPFKLAPDETQCLLLAGVAAGFGSVFGTPWAGALFGLEVINLRSLRWQNVAPCLIASFAADATCQATGITHHVYRVPTGLGTNWLWVGIAGLAFAAASFVFVELTHALKQIKLGKYTKVFVGSLLVIGLTWAVGTRDYNGLSLPLLERCFTDQGITDFAFALKIVFTVVTLGCGLKGGEVTPLFVIGATLGYMLGVHTGQPPVLFAALGFVAVFAGATNTPLTCAIMGMELFGYRFGVPLLVVCLVATLLSGGKTIYESTGRWLSRIEGADEVLDLETEL